MSGQEIDSNATTHRDSIDIGRAPRADIISQLQDLTPEQLAAVFRAEVYGRNFLAELVMRARNSAEEFLAPFIAITQHIPANDLLLILQGGRTHESQPFDMATILSVNRLIAKQLLQMAEPLTPQQQAVLFQTPLGITDTPLIKKLIVKDPRYLNHLEDHSILALLAHAAAHENDALNHHLASQQAGRQTLQVFFQLSAAGSAMRLKAIEYADQRSDARQAKHQVASELVTHINSILAAATQQPMNMLDAIRGLFNYWSQLHREYAEAAVKNSCTYGLAIQGSNSKFKQALDEFISPIIKAFMKSPSRFFNTPSMLSDIRAGSDLPSAIRIIPATRELYLSLAHEEMTYHIDEGSEEQIAVSSSYRMRLKSILPILERTLALEIKNEASTTASFDLFVLLTELENDGSAQNECTRVAIQQLTDILTLSAEIHALSFSAEDENRPTDETILKMHTLMNRCPSILTQVLSTPNGIVILNYLAENEPRLMHSLIKNSDSDGWNTIFDSGYVAAANADWNLLGIMLKNPLRDSGKQRDNPMAFLEIIISLKPEHISRLITADVVLSSVESRPDMIPAFLPIIFELPVLEFQLPFWLRLFQPGVDGVSRPHTYIMQIIKTLENPIPAPARIALIRTATTSNRADLLECISFEGMPELEVISKSLIAFQQKPSENEWINGLIKTLQDTLNSDNLNTRPLSAFLQSHSRSLLEATTGNSELCSALGSLSEAFFKCRTSPISALTRGGARKGLESEQKDQLSTTP